MLVSTCVSIDQKLFWFRQWINQFGVFREAQKFPKQRFLDATFDKWFHKATFLALGLIFNYFLFLFSMNRSRHRFWNANHLLTLWTSSWNFGARGGGNQVV
jgi:hypothetical protein